MPDDVAILISNEDRGSMREQLGNAHYSYRFAESNFRRILEREYTVLTTPAPYYFNSASEIQREFGTEETSFVHIAFRSYENLRPVKGAYNICAFAWEFDVLSNDQSFHMLPFQNQVYALSLFDEVWCTSHYTRAVLDKFHVDADLIHLPAPVPDVWGGCAGEKIGLLDDPEVYPLRLNTELNASLYFSSLLTSSTQLSDFMEPALNKQQLVFAVLSPGDQRKNMVNLICAFSAASDEFPDARLLIKVSITNDERITYRGIESALQRGLGSEFSICTDVIGLLPGFLESSVLSKLYESANFFISPSICEGQNLPLIESMLAKCVPICTQNTAMLDYISCENSVIIDTRRVPATFNTFAPTEHKAFFEVDVATSFDIYQAIVRAFSLGGDQLAEKSERARIQATSLFGDDKIKMKVAERMSAAFPRARRAGTYA